MNCKINLEKAVEDFCKEFGICPNSREKLLLELAIQRGIMLTLEEDIKNLKKKLGE